MSLVDADERSGRTGAKCWRGRMPDLDSPARIAETPRAPSLACRARNYSHINTQRGLCARAVRRAAHPLFMERYEIKTGVYNALHRRARR